jgi:hypothetical protein
MSRHLPLGQIEISNDGQGFIGVCKYCNSKILGSWDTKVFSGWKTELGAEDCA